MALAVTPTNDTRAGHYNTRSPFLSCGWHRGELAVATASREGSARRRHGSRRLAAQQRSSAVPRPHGQDGELRVEEAVAQQEVGASVAGLWGPQDPVRAQPEDDDAQADVRAQRARV